MPYKALYRTYRPKTFSEVVGQKAIVKTLQNALSADKIAHAYLFCGPRGTGKTTMARLFAKALNCSEGVGHECNKCENCLDILEGKHPDVYEIDAASNSGVDNVRSLIEQVGFAPMLGRYKVYIIDEVHSMTGAAFNALLKTLEEPPANVVFILATTEPDEVLPTILSRVQRFDFSKVSDEDLILNMKHILEKEGIAYEDQALAVIARLAQGGVRDSLSLLDSAISYGGDKVTEETVDTLFGLLKISDELEIVKKIHVNDVKAALAIIKDKFAEGADVRRLHEDLTDIYKDLLVYGITKDPRLLTYLKKDEADFTLVTPPEVRRNLDILIKSRREYKTALSAYDQLELTVLSMAVKPEEETQAAPKVIQPAPSAAVQPAVIKIPTPEIKAAPLPEPAQPVKKAETENPLKENPASPVAPGVTTSDEQPRTITTASLERFDEMPESGEGLVLSKDDVINMMLQGNKMIKLEISKDWEDKLKTIPNSDDLGYLASQLLKAVPSIAAPGVLVVKSFFKGTVLAVNLFSNQPKGQALMKRLFGKDMKIVAVDQKDFVDYTTYFMNKMQANDLPAPKEIVIPSVKNTTVAPQGPSNAENFISSLSQDSTKPN
jgi:DNA polymerase-3 subunit gamma/tau